jgi:hypothetical protein
MKNFDLPRDRTPRIDCLWHHGMDIESRLIQRNLNKPHHGGSLPFYCTAKTARTNNAETTADTIQISKKEKKEIAEI